MRDRAPDPLSQGHSGNPALLPAGQSHQHEAERRADDMPSVSRSPGEGGYSPQVSRIKCLVLPWGGVRDPRRPAPDPGVPSCRHFLQVENPICSAQKLPQNGVAQDNNRHLLFLVVSVGQGSRQGPWGRLLSAPRRRGPQPAAQRLGAESLQVQFPPPPTCGQGWCHLGACGAVSPNPKGPFRAAWASSHHGGQVPRARPRARATWKPRCLF